MDTPNTSPVPAGPSDPADLAAPGFTGRTTSKASAIRAGMVLGTALVVVIGAAVAIGAGRGSPAGVGADPQLAAASGSPAPHRDGGHGDGHRFGVGFGRGGFGPAVGLGPIFGFGGRPDKALGHGFGRVTITAIEGASVSLATDDGWTRTIQLTSATTITRGGAAATAAALHVGDEVRFRQQRNDDGTYTITAIDIVLPTVLGTIESTGSGSITIIDRDGATITVHLGAATKIRVRGVEAASPKDLAKGQVVIVVGERRSDGSIDATGLFAGKLGELAPDGPKHDRPNASDAPSASDAAG